MAESFQPRFVDLVRNTTTTSGTGNFVLGPAVYGFTSFASAIKTGESFYYSAISVDKPEQREVGRGTMEADGTISRDPVGGPRVNFSLGVKTIALVAAAEWFEKVQAGSGTGGVSGASTAATRTALSALASALSPALLYEPGREGLFVFDSTDLSAKVASDPLQGVYVAPSSDPSGADGAWVRKYDGHLNAAWFGATPGGDIAPVMRAMLTFVGDSAATAFLPPSETPYQWNSKVDWTGSLSLYSQKTVAALSAVLDGFLHGALIKVPAGVTAILPHNTANTYCSGASFSGLSFRATGQANASTTGSIAKDSRTLALATAQDFANGQIIRVRGAGPSGYLQGNGLRGTTAAGSPVIACTGATPAAVVGQVLNVSGAFPAGSHVVSSTADSITMSANATSTVSTPAKISLYGDLYGCILSGGGTTTIELTSMAHAAVTDAKVEHYDCALFAFGGVTVDGIAGEGFKGALAAMVGGNRYVSPGDPTQRPNANCVVWNNIIARTGTNGVLIDGTDANNCRLSDVSTISTTEWGIVDQSFLGNYWPRVHVSGSYGVLHVIEPASQSQFESAYTEGGTRNSFGNSATGTGYQSGWEDGGVRFMPWNGSLNAPCMNLFPLGAPIAAYTGDQSATGRGIISANLSGVGGSVSLQLFDYHRSGIVGITDGAANTSLLAFTMASDALGAGHTLVNSLYVGDGTQGAGAIDATKVRRLGVGSAAPAAAVGGEGDRVLNKLVGGTQPTGWLRSVNDWFPLRGSSHVITDAGTSRTAAAGDANGYVRFTSGTPVTFTVPPNSTVAFPVGTVIELEQAGAGAVTIAAAAGVSLNSRDAVLTLAGQYAVAALKKVESDSWTLTGDL